VGVFSLKLPFEFSEAVFNSCDDVLVVVNISKKGYSIPLKKVIALRSDILS